MTQHVYARLAGFGLIVVPRAPFEIRQAAESAGQLRVEYRPGNGKPMVVQLIPGEDGYQSKLCENTQSLFDVVDVKAGPAINQWRIETTVFTCCWPGGFALCSNRPGDPGPFDLIGQRGEMIWIQQPRRIPDVADLCAENQAVINIERGDAWDAIDLQYDHDEQSWRQRHIVVSLQDRRIAVTMQSPAEFADEATAAANKLAASLTAYEEV